MADTNKAHSFFRKLFDNEGDFLMFTIAHTLRCTWTDLTQHLTVLDRDNNQVVADDRPSEVVWYPLANQLCFDWNREDTRIHDDKPITVYVRFQEHVQFNYWSDEDEEEYFLRIKWYKLFPGIEDEEINDWSFLQLTADELQEKGGDFIC